MGYPHFRHFRLHRDSYVPDVTVTIRVFVRVDSFARPRVRVCACVCTRCCVFARAIATLSLTSDLDCALVHSFTRSLALGLFLSLSLVLSLSRALPILNVHSILVSLPHWRSCSFTHFLSLFHSRFCSSLALFPSLSTSLPIRDSFTQFVHSLSSSLSFTPDPRFVHSVRTLARCISLSRSHALPIPPRSLVHSAGLSTRRSPLPARECPFRHLATVVLCIRYDGSGRARLLRLAGSLLLSLSLSVSRRLSFSPSLSVTPSLYLADSFARALCCAPSLSVALRRSLSLSRQRTRVCVSAVGLARSPSVRPRSFSLGTWPADES